MTQIFKRETPAGRIEQWLKYWLRRLRGTP